MDKLTLKTPRRDEPTMVRSSAGWLYAFWRRHSYIVPGFALSLVVCMWFVTCGDFRFFDRERFCGFYDAQARSILSGHFDVPPEAIGIEAFIFRGKTYGYFGIAPAILRMPLVLLFKNMDWRWSRSIMMGGFALNLLCAYWLILWIRGPEQILTNADRTLDSLFILCAGLGSTNIFLVARSHTYHEAIMLGGVFALLFTVSLVKYLAAPSLARLTLIGMFSFMSFHSRPTAGAGTLLALCVVAWILIIRSIAAWFSRPCLKNENSRVGSPSSDIETDRTPPRPDSGRSAGASKSSILLGFKPIEKPLPHALIAILSIVVIIGVYFGVNYGRFRTLDGAPLQYYGYYFSRPELMKITGGKMVHPENIPTMLVCYFGLRGVTIQPEFPWIFLRSSARRIGSPALVGVWGYSSIPVSMPALLLLALIGCARAMRGRTERQRRMRLPVVALMFGGGILLTTVGITERYLHDFYPFLIAAGAVGVLRVSQNAAPSSSDSVERGVHASVAEVRTRVKIGVLLVLALISIVLNCTFALEYQRMMVWGMSQAKRDEFLHFRQAVQHFLHGPAIPADLK